MELSSLSPRAEPATPTAAAADRPAPHVLSTAAETARPVLAAAKADPANGRMEQEFQPLDTFEVGDNDHVPVPPEPPREETVRAIMAHTQDADVEDAAPIREEALETALRDIEDGPENPTVDIRR